MSAAVTLLLAVTFVAAAVAKLRAPQPFVATLQTLVPARMAAPLARAVPVGELALAAALLTAVAPRATALAVLAVLAGFSTVLVRLRRGPAGADGPAVLPCNCFGAGDGDPSTGLVRNGLLALLAVAAAVWPLDGPVWTLPAAQLAGAATVALGAACVWHLATALVPLTRLVRS